MLCKKSNKRKFSIIAILVFSVSTAIIAAVAIPAYNFLIMNSKEKIAINFAAIVAQSANAYYWQNGSITPVYSELNILSPEGYSPWIVGFDVVVCGDGTPGYSVTDFMQQTVRWK